jgi:hypothetical protein
MVDWWMGERSGFKINEDSMTGLLISMNGL